MNRSNNEKYGFAPKQWGRFKKEAREIMVGVARNRQMITYSDMAAQMTTIAVEAHDQVLWDIIGDVAKDEEHAGRGLLSAVVVHKHGDMEPGKGFFDLAKFFNRNLSNRTECWVDEIKSVYKLWSVKMVQKKPSK